MKAFHRFMGLLLLILLAGGCAVLTIDVDVYKGSLANHPEVQIQQAVAMATGAKPLLIQLRDYLECQSTDAKKLATFRARLQKEGIYRTGFIMPAYTNSSKEWALSFSNVIAMRINAALSLYDDQPFNLLRKDLQDMVQYSHQFSELQRPYNSTNVVEAYSICGRILRLATEAKGLLPGRKDLSPDLATALSDHLTFVIDALSPTTAQVEQIGLTNAALATEIETWKGSVRRSGVGTAEIMQAHRGLANSSIGISDGPLWLAQVRSSAALSPSNSADVDLTFVSEIESVAVLGDLEILVVDSGTGFERGRSNQGLDSLITKYLTLYQEYRTNDYPQTVPEVEGARTQLLDELARFAQKILFAANYSPLVEPHERPGFLADFWDFAYGGLYGDRFANRFIHSPIDYNRVLQAVGNSILVQVDELRQFQKAYDSSSINTYRETFALTNSFTTHFLETLQAESHGKVATEKDYTERTNSLQQFEQATNNLFSLSTNAQYAEAAYKRSAQVNIWFTNPPSTIKALIDNTNLPATDFISRLNEELNNAKRLDPIQTNWPLWIMRADLVNQVVPSLKPSDAKTSKEVFQRLTGGLQQLESSNINVVVAVQQLVDDAISVSNKAKIRLDAANAAITEGEHTTQAKITLEVLTGAGGILSELQSLDALDLRLIKQVLLDRTNQASKKNDTNLVTKLTIASKTLDSFPDHAIRRIGPDLNITNSKDVLDTLIASLRYEYIRVVEDAGETSPLAKQIAASLTVAIQQRTDMIYIRPASAYLRTSFPATSLQKDAQLGWHNMLAEHGIHQLPFASKFEKTKDLRILNEIDKQFWQNINTVRVAGGGNNNYVVAKDDVGNWYVKSYSANPKDIIRSAQNLASFGMGAAIGGSLPIKSRIGETLNSSTTNSGSLLQAEYDKFTGNYTNDARTAYDKLQKELTAASLKSKLDGAWKSAGITNLNDLDSLADSSTSQLASLPKDPDSKQAIEKQVIDGLKSAEKYFSSVCNGTQSAIGKSNDSSLTNKGVAASKQAASEFLNSYLDERRQALSQYETALTVINDEAK